MEDEYETVMGITNRLDNHKRTYQRVRLIPKDDGRVEIKILNLAPKGKTRNNSVKHVVSSLEDIGLPTVTEADKIVFGTQLNIQLRTPSTPEKIAEYVTKAGMDQSEVIIPQLMKTGSGIILRGSLRSQAIRLKSPKASFS